jgi:hypothetical protein
MSQQQKEYLNPFYPSVIKSWIDIIKEKGFELTVKYVCETIPTYEIFLNGVSLELYFPYRDKNNNNRFEGLYNMLMLINDTIWIVKQKCQQEQ